LFSGASLLDRAGGFGWPELLSESIRPPDDVLGSTDCKKLGFGLLTNAVVELDWNPATLTKGKPLCAVLKRRD
jgi:hypothetical protein